jgi:hypothetical protein
MHASGCFKGYTRARMVSGLTILRADEAPEAISYAGI